jgi:hypothetical protein
MKPLTRTLGNTLWKFNGYPFNKPRFGGVFLCPPGLLKKEGYPIQAESPGIKNGGTLFSDSMGHIDFVKFEGTMFCKCCRFRGL